MNKFFYFCLLLTSLMACNNSDEQEPIEINAFADDTVTATSVLPERKSATYVDVDSAHNSENSLDWDGTYKGVLPCADCEGIETELQLNKDKTFTLSQLYKGKSGSPVIRKAGFTWIDGTKIRLEGDDKSPSVYMVGEGQLYQLDMDQRIIKGPLAKKYILKKQ